MKGLLKSIIVILLIVINMTMMTAQVSTTSIVEHFTNTSCSICANNNDGYYKIISNYPNALHISFHPSSPYANDFFNQQNRVENDARTNFYDIFGGTPRLVVNGSVISNSTLNNTLSEAANTTSNFEIKILQRQSSTNTFEIKTVVKKVANDTLSSALFFSGVVEDTIYKTTNNGEKVHYNVFRKSLTTPNGQIIALPHNIGDSIVSNINYTAASDWNTTRLHTIGILQRLDKSAINATKSINSSTNTTGSSDIHYDVLKVYPNPSKIGIFYLNKGVEELHIYNSSGQLVKSIKNILPNQMIETGGLESGMYFLQLTNKNTHYYHKIIID